LSFSTGTVEGVRQIEIQDCLESVLSLLERSLRTHRVRVHKEVGGKLPRIPARRQDIEQLFLNLLTNARESMPEGGELSIRIWLDDDDEEQKLRILVTDTGRGIPSEMLPRVFEPFFTTKVGGTGLGLDICRSIVWEYGGALQLESEIGRGTEAHVCFPCRAERPTITSEDTG
jgi:signal transduction histidine kinase